MASRKTLGLALSAAFVVALSAGTASAQLRDRPRVRLGAALEGGGLFVPGVVDLGFVGIQGQLGVQFNNLVGLYVAPNFDIVSGARESGVQVGGAVLIDFTLWNVLTLGVGPDLAGFAALGGGRASGGIIYGTRLHLAVNPLVRVDDRGGRRHALTIGLDLHLSTDGGAGTLSARRASAGEFLAQPTLTIGYQAF